jgi:hypothetical protein
MSRFLIIIIINLNKNIGNPHTGCEIVWARIEIANKKPLYIGSFYRTPSKDDPEIINQLHESVSKLTCKKDDVLPNIIINGDINTPDIIWEDLTVNNNPNYSMSIDFSHRFSDSNIVQRSSMSFFTFSIFPFLY